MANATHYTTLASDEPSSSFADVSSIDTVKRSPPPQHNRLSLTTQRNRYLAMMNHRRSSRQEKRVDPSKPRARRVRHEDCVTSSALIRKLGRLVAKLQKDPGHCSSSLLDRFEALTRQLRKRIKTGEKKALTTAFSGRPPQVMMQ
jgi:hypothetical protein